ncbi:MULTISPECIES: bifunctional glutathionylspermidine amidase/synthase [unclassified Tatumella]|uniref:bifunctional glutathionylspermidine amidase/synthase n=1 Tax=unclassified Tatumella TaxID=2649542 RepID=UPI001BB06B48|nr:MULTISPECIES: bifunctional glutathionylspermidine amidase/synthase [unclassified Tatumella]MBS0878085.1 bifunctional glutathionylspermidine amidase/synthase [Tatumella sp. JGM82]MBS0890444.1 bifunctional glutathionylspermidine amidase/synthase [Tatumella sp. JGM94]MBS0900900.1 bifunctional glutathionylspermidine amidase/synthase [Tatumella sp. JGM100]
MTVDLTNNHAPFGTLLGYAPGGVAIYSSDYDSLDSEEYPDDSSLRSFLGNEFMGYKWQCVEFARRFLYLNYGMVFTDVRMAYEIFSLRFLRQVINDDILPLQAFANGCPRPPVSGALLIWQQGGEFADTGHVAMITRVFADKVQIVEQNVIHSPLPAGQQWTRQLPLRRQNGLFFIDDTFDDTQILGWMIQTCDNSDSLPEPVTAGKLLAIHPHRIRDNGQFSGPWLNEDDPVQSAYIRASHGHIINADPHQYFTLSRSAEQELIRATNELHLMYLHATDKVLRDDALLRLFDIPEILWPRLRLSWQRRRHHMVTGRLDFCLDERGLKVYEYNADSASCHTEAGVILGKWAQQGGVSAGKDPCRRLVENLSAAWKHSDALPFVHILQDEDAEENYHALLMQQALTDAGFDSKILHGLVELHWSATGLLIDDDQREVNCVWKTWAWETVLEQLRQETENDATATLPVRTGEADQVRLMDVLLRPEVMVFEPLWTVIPGNKAILPILWSLFPHHKYLLDTDFTVNQELQQTGYAIKPIGGRCGSNIGLVSHQEQMLDETAGKFAHQTNIYQQLWCLPQVAGRYIQVCTFTVGGHYGGACLRSDPTLVIKKESDIEPLRIIKDRDFSR